MAYDVTPNTVSWRHKDTRQVHLREVFAWPEEAVALLARLWRAGDSYLTIAAAINERYGTKLTRNAIAGRCARLGLKRMESGARDHRPVKRAPKMTKEARTEARKPAPRPAKEAPPMVLLTYDALTAYACRWIEGDPRRDDHRYCGNPGFPYCAHHRSVCYVKGQAR